MVTDVVGLRFVATGERETLAAMERYAKVNTDIQQATQASVSAIERMERQVKTLQAGLASGRVGQDNYAESLREIKRQYAALTGGSIQKASAEVGRFARALEEEKRKTEELTAARQRAETAWSLAMQRHREETAAQQAATKERERTTQAFARFSAQIDPAIAAQQRLANAQKIVNDAIRTGAISADRGRAAMAAYQASLSATERAVLRAGSATSAIRTQFLATANSIAVLDGPLGGVASRFSAFGVLIGRTGIAIGGALVGFAALGTVLNRGIRNLVEWEAQSARINAILTVTGNAAGLTGAQIETMASRIALATLESEQGVRAAAASLLTFRDISSDVFESVLKSATDLAALGFGTVESETKKLAKALEDPAQALTSLSRAGIVFTRQQRAVIISLIESGERAQAMEKILENVRARTQGAAEAAASGTLAGAFDTIGQAVGRATRDFARWILTVTGAEEVIQRVAAGVADYAGNQPVSLAQRIRDQELVVAAIIAGRANALREEADIRAKLQAFSLRQIQLGADELANMQERLAELKDYSAESEKQARLELEKLRQERELLALRQQQTKVDRVGEGLANIQQEIDLRRQLIGLTEDEQTVRRALAGEGLLMTTAQITQRVLDYRKALFEATGDWRIANIAAEAHRQQLLSIANAADEYLKSLQAARDARETISRRDSLLAENALLTEQLNLNRAGMSLADARTRAEYNIEEAKIAQRLAAANLNAADRANLLQLRQALRLQQVLQRILEQRREAEAEAEAARRGAEAGRERLAQMAAENEIIRSMLDHGERSQVVEALREQQARDTLDAFIQQNKITGQLEVNLRAALDTQQALARQQQRLNDLQAKAGSLVDDVANQRELLVLLRAGNSEEQARTILAERQRDAQNDTLVRAAAALLATKDLGVEARKVAEGILDAARAAAELAQNTEAALTVTRAFDALENRTRNIVEQNELMRLQIALIDSGVEYTVALTRAEIELAIRRAQTLAETASTTEEMERQLAIVNALRAAQGEYEILVKKLESRRPARGGAAGRPEPTLEEEMQKMLQRIERERQLIELHGMAKAELQAYFDLYDALGDAAARYTKSDIEQAAQRVAAAQEELNQKQRLLQLQEQMASTMTTLFMAAVDGAKAFRQALSNLLRQLAQLLANKAFMSLISGSSIGAPGSLNAKGNAFAGGNVIPFARGGVVGSPTLFPMSRGRTGLMGEAGPEAIMPLRRGRDGKLGVQSAPQQVVVTLDLRSDMLEAKIADGASKVVVRRTPTIVGQAVAATYASSTERKFG